MASTSVLLRSTAYTARRSLLAGACNCRTSDGSLNFKGKNRAHIHSNAKAQAEESPSTHTATVNAQSAFAQRTRSMPDEPAAVAAEETSVSQAAANEPVEEARPQPSTPEELEVFERRRRMSLMEELESMGSSQTRENTWQPRHSFTRTQTPQSVTLSHLIASTAHIGHSQAIGNPMAFSSIYGTRHGVSIIDMRETLTALRRAAALVKSTVENDGIVLFVGSRNIKDSEKVLTANASKMGRNGYATSRWLPGTLTNSRTIYQASASMLDPQTNATSFLPSLIVLFAPLAQPHTLREANAMSIPTIALCDSNVDPRHFTYPIPCNDDSLRVFELISGVLAEAGKEGAKVRDAKQEQAKAAANTLAQQYQVQQKNAYQQRQRRLR